jgi:tetratricopeptide (TPR) repeat protein
VQLKDSDDGTWIFDSATGIALRSVARTSRIEVELCGRCHSRRAIVHEEYVHGAPLTDTHLPSFLQAGLYHADGQILDEVYVYGSFLQSKMYREGVTCRDCHDPHSLRLHGSVDTVCARCHLPARFDTTEHHLHAPGSAGARCVACHMPEKIYMVVDPRRDHSFRIPRPDLSVELGTPNACTGCHDDRPAAWAAKALEGRDGAKQPHYAQALHAGRGRLPGAARLLEQLAGDAAWPGIVRATALSMMRDGAGPGSVAVIERGLVDDDPLVRIAAAQAAEIFEPVARPRLLLPLLDDPVRTVRAEAARALAPARAGSLTARQRARLDAVLDEYRAMQHVNRDRAEAHLNLGLLHVALGEQGPAEQAYRAALVREPWFLPAYVNLADLYRATAREERAEQVLRQALGVAPESPEVHHALGLALIRQDNVAEAMGFLRRAAELRPAEPRYAYVYGVGQHSAGDTAGAVATLEVAHGRHPGDPDLLLALITIQRDRGARETAVRYAEKLVTLLPGDAQARRLLEQLKAGGS